MTSDPHMISDDALNARYSDQHVIAVRSSCEHTGDDFIEALARVRVAKPGQVASFLLAAKRGLYRETGEYSQAALKAQMQRKPRPTCRPMAGHGSNAYRTWSR